VADDSLQRVPPQSLEAEMSVLGSMLLDKEAIAKAVEMLRPGDFYREAHRLIFEGIVQVFDEGEAVDLITVSEKLRQMGVLEEVGGVSYIATLANSVPTAANLEYYARIVQEKSVLRQLIAAATQIVTRCYEGREDAEVILDEAEQMIFQVSQRRGSPSYVPMREVLIESLERIEYLYSHKGAAYGVPTGFTDLDRLTSGLQPADLAIVAARPSVGKSTFVLNIARHVAVKERMPVAIFSLEMAKEQLAQRLLCAEASIDGQKLRTGFLNEDDWKRLSRALGRLGDAPIFVDDTPNISVLELRAKARRIKAEHGLALLIIDYLQLMQTRGRQENRQQEISEISRSLKALGRELRVPVLACSQLSRAVEQRQDRRPMLSDLRESGAIEQDADLVAFLYVNPEFENQNVVEVIVAKQRNGPTGSVRLYFHRNLGRFENLETRHPGPDDTFAP